MKAQGGNAGTLQRPKIHARNPRTLTRRAHPRQDRAVNAVTAFAGSLTFVYLHLGWFGSWVLVNSGLLGAQLVFDAFPFGLLTLVVSLEAIFLSTFVLISQNREAQQTKVQTQLNYEADVRSETWSVQIGSRLGLDAQEVEQQVQQALADNQRTIETNTPADGEARPDTTSTAGKAAPAGVKR